MGVKGFTKKQYVEKCRYLARKAYGSDIPDGFHVDHVYSVNDGWKNGVPPEIISHPANLCLIPADENMRKKDESVISLEELFQITGRKELRSDES